MTGGIRNDQLDRVTAALAENSRQLDSVRNGAWRFLSRAAFPCSFSAVLSGQWLILSADNIPDHLGLIAPWDLLVRNAALPALVKFVFLTQGVLQLRAELPLSEDAGPAERIRETCEGLVSAL